MNLKKSMIVCACMIGLAISPEMILASPIPNISRELPIESVALDNTLYLDESFNNQLITVKKEQPIQIKLYSLLGAGYTWQQAGVTDKKIVTCNRVDNPVFVPNNTSFSQGEGEKHGVKRLQNFQFKAINEGKTDLYFNYEGTRETGEVERSFHLTIQVMPDEKIQLNESAKDKTITLEKGRKYNVAAEELGSLL
jgi:predicted secreted protein